MKEYLNTKTYEYKQAHTKPDGEWVWIPEGADKYVYFSEYDNANFYKGDFDAVWQDDGYWDHDMDDYKSYCKKFSVVLWQRPTQPEALPFIDDNPQSLNDKYAEIEKVRQAIKVKSGSDSDHALDAMSFGLMGARDAQASGGAKMRENNHYFIDVSDVDEVDFYEIAKRYNVTDPAVQHILKKCLAIGNRGHKDLETDLKDILKTAKRALQINGFGG